ncbi:MAG: c-type cytochrome [Alcanivoracaceae bacterium]|jgi:cytochrome c553|nr:c-type cytochrome [Alcanivoracaceae bacterium]
MKFSKVVMALVCSLAVAPAMALEGDADAGKNKAAVCGACHGADGNSDAPANPKLAGQGEAYLVKQLMNFKSGERENAIMMGQAQGLSEQDMADLAAYYASQSIEVGQADPALVEAGERIYRGGNMATGLSACAGCHGPAGAGIDAAGFPALGGQHAAYTVAQLKAFRAAGRNDEKGPKRANDPNAMMRSVAAKMSDDEIKAVASYISGLSQ